MGQTAEKLFFCIPGTGKGVSFLQLINASILARPAVGTMDTDNAYPRDTADEQLSRPLPLSILYYFHIVIDAGVPLRN